jgi:hypothetical protein
VLIPLRPSNEHILIVRVPGAGINRGVIPPFHCARSASKKDGLAAPYPFLSSLLEGGLFGLPLRASNEGLQRPRVARAQETISLHPFLWRLLPTLSQGSGRGCPLLRASNEHRFIVRVLRARRAAGRSPPSSIRTSSSPQP